jgi:hypothetical protein
MLDLHQVRLRQSLHSFSLCFFFIPFPLSTSLPWLNLGVDASGTGHSADFAKVPNHCFGCIGVSLFSFLVLSFRVSGIALLLFCSPHRHAVSPQSPGSIAGACSPVEKHLPLVRMTA